MAAPYADLESGHSFLPLAVRCRGSTGTIDITPQGDFVFKPHPRPRGVLPWLSGLLHPHTAQHIPAAQLLGARREGPGAFTVWYAQEACSRSGCVEKKRYRACSTPCFETKEPSAVTALIDLVRSITPTFTSSSTSSSAPTTTTITASSPPWSPRRRPHIAAIVN
ncbi:hypothetical protein Agub_g5145, partial [Astrephomene gubernaculifera]